MSQPGGQWQFGVDERDQGRLNFVAGTAFGNIAQAFDYDAVGHKLKILHNPANDNLAVTTFIFFAGKHPHLPARNENRRHLD